MRGIIYKYKIVTTNDDKSYAVQIAAHEHGPPKQTRHWIVAGWLLCCYQPFPAQAEIDQIRYCSFDLVFTTATMLGIQYPKDAQINHKIINAFDIPSYKMTPHF